MFPCNINIIFHKTIPDKQFYYVTIETSCTLYPDEFLYDTCTTPVLSTSYRSITIYRVCVLGTANGWFLKLTTKVHIDQIIEGFAQNCPYLLRLEIQWDPDTIRFSDKSNKFVDHIRFVWVIFLAISFAVNSCFRNFTFTCWYW